ncbi:hypothetical protein CMV_021069 [Castanea mollissima]|uniref:Uncharacterized protein n=1 Tax=Castanea mollissima TaxID=60419 RepID=A0A8J4QPK3_9ROSI|nr:hypothetical protein CMV_021069 [Castanea mollissima]
MPSKNVNRNACKGARRGSGLRLNRSINCQLFWSLVYSVNSRFIKILEWTGVVVSLKKLLELSKPGVSVKMIASCNWQTNKSGVAVSLMKLLELLKPAIGEEWVWVWVRLDGVRLDGEDARRRRRSEARRRRRSPKKTQQRSTEKTQARRRRRSPEKTLAGEDPMGRKINNKKWLELTARPSSPPHATVAPRLKIDGFRIGFS